MQKAVSFRMKIIPAALFRMKIVSGIVSHNFAGHRVETLQGFAFQFIHDLM